jgi:hypothetical protein
MHATSHIRAQYISAGEVGAEDRGAEEEGAEEKDIQLDRQNTAIKLRRGTQVAHLHPIPLVHPHRVELIE